MKRFQGVVKRMESFGMTVQARSQRPQRVDVASGFQPCDFRLQLCALRRESISLFA